MKKIMIVLSICFVFALVNNANAQRHASGLVIDRNQDPDSTYLLISEKSDNIKYRQGKGKWVNYQDFIDGEISGLEPVNKHWFNADLISNGNHTHNARGFSSRVENIGQFEFVSGSNSHGSMTFDSNDYQIIDSTITLRANKNLFLYGPSYNPNIYLVGDPAQIIIDSDNGDTEIKHLTRDDNAANVVGINSTTGQLYLKSGITSGTPASDTITGVAGKMMYDANFLYLWTGTNQIKKIALSSF